MSETDKPAKKGHGFLHPVIMILVILVLAAVLTHILPSGRYERVNNKVMTESYQIVPKINGLPAILSTRPAAETDTPAQASGVVSFISAIPDGFVKKAELLFMVLFVGGLFGILRTTGSIDALINKMLFVTTGNIYILTAGVMLLLASGASFLGFISEYLVIVPIVLALGQRLGLPNIFAAAVVVVAGMIGYAASVANPILLSVAQPLAGVPIFSGMLPRLFVFVAMLSVSVSYVLFYMRRFPTFEYVPEPSLLTGRQSAVLIALLLGGIVLVVGTGVWTWGTGEHAAVFVALGMILALVGGLSAGEGADAFIDGMKSMVLPAVMIGLAGAMEIILRSSQVLDSTVHTLSALIDGQTPGVVAMGMMLGEMGFDVLIHSSSAKAAISLPILAPVAQLAGVSGHVSVMALAIGGGLTNMITPTNGLLLAFLAAAKVDYREWVRFIAPLFLILCLIGFATLWTMAMMGM
jgi:uncharacterized ion transporter superfamily protein YfcC